VALALLGMVAVSVAAQARPVRRTDSFHSPSPVTVVRKPDVLNPNLSNRPSHTFNLHTHLGFPRWLTAGILELLILAGVLLLILLVVKVVPRLHRRARSIRRPPAPVRMAPEDSDSLGEQVSHTFDAALARLLRGEREEAIIACWLQLERLAEAAGFPAQSWQTSGELVERWPDVLPLSRQPLTELAELYREARFSSHRMTAEAAERARHALATLRAELGNPVPGRSHA
jgi:hypothetical protein